MKIGTASAEIGRRFKLLQWYRGVAHPGRASPLELVMIQATPFCNIDCSYCYLPNRSKKGQFSLELLDPLFTKLSQSGLLGESVSVVWHAGEPLVLPPAYYREAIERIRRLVDGKCRATHFIQTNGTLVTEAYCELITSKGIQIGLSIDGPAHIHNQNRVTRNKTGTHEQVMAGVRLLQKNGIGFTVIAVLTAYSLDYPDEIYDFFRHLGVREVGFNVDEVDGINARSSLGDAGMEERFPAFMRRILRRMIEDKMALTVRELTQALALVSGSLIGRSVLSSEANPFSILSCDMNGDLFTFSPELLDISPADGSDFCIGNIRTIDFESIFDDPRFSSVNAEVQADIALCRESCSYFPTCGGGAPANKLGENGTFASTETMFCRYKKKIIVDVVEEYILEFMTQRRQRVTLGRSRGPVTLHAPEQPKRNSTAAGPGPDKLSRSATFRSRTDVGGTEARTGQGEYSSISNTVQLTAGLPIVTPDGSDTRIRISNGTTTRSDAVDPDMYHHAARLPRHPWHLPNAVEMTALRAESSMASPMSFVAVVRPPANLLEPLLALGAELAQTRYQERLGIDPAHSPVVTEAAVALAKIFGSPNERTRTLGVGVNPPGRPTLTVSGSENLRIGLHVDSWSKLPANKRFEAPNRLCINLGRDVRQLLFINLPLRDIIARLPGGTFDPCTSGATDLARAFMTYNPTYPVVAIEIAPGEAYVAPTEDLIHDGCSEGMKNNDVCLTMLGYFSRPASRRR
jgi:uncharacterized protein